MFHVARCSFGANSHARSPRASKRMLRPFSLAIAFSEIGVRDAVWCRDGRKPTVSHFFFEY